MQARIVITLRVFAYPQKGSTQQPTQHHHSHHTACLHVTTNINSHDSSNESTSKPVAMALIAVTCLFSNSLRATVRMIEVTSLHPGFHPPTLHLTRWFRHSMVNVDHGVLTPRPASTTITHQQPREDKYTLSPKLEPRGGWFSQTKAAILSNRSSRSEVDIHFSCRKHHYPLIKKEKKIRSVYYYLSLPVIFFFFFRVSDSAGSFQRTSVNEEWGKNRASVWAQLKSRDSSYLPVAWMVTYLAGMPAVNPVIEMLVLMYMRRWYPSGSQEPRSSVMSSFLHPGIASIVRP